MKDFLKRRKRFVCLVAPALFGVLYMFLCIANIRQSIWFDESYSAYLTRFSFPEVWNLTAQDVHPPLYYFVLKIWGHFFGHTDYALRILSTLFGAAAILIAFLWVKYRFGNTAALFASFALSISPTLIRYGQEMRMYTMVLCIVFAASYLLELAINTKSKKYWYIYGALVAIGMWTHYFTAFAWIAHVIYLALIYKKKFFSKQIIRAYAFAVLLFIPWIPGFIMQIGSVQGGFWIGDASVTTVANYLTELSFYEKASNVENWGLLIFIAEIISFIYLLVKHRKKVTSLSILTFTPVFLLILVSMPPLSPMFVPRYVMYSTCATSMLVAILIVLEFRRKESRAFLYVISLVLLVGNIFGLANLYRLGNFNMETGQKSTSKDLFETIAAIDGDENLPIICDNAWLYYDLSFYTSENHPVFFINEKTEYIYGSMKPLEQSKVGRIDNLDEFLENHKRVWYVGAQPDNGELKFPRQKWSASEINNYKFDNNSDAYQVIRFEK